MVNGIGCGMELEKGKKTNVLYGWKKRRMSVGGTVEGCRGGTLSEWRG